VPIPSDITAIRVFATYLHGDGTAAQGQVSFTPSITAQTTDGIFVDVATVVYLDRDTGSFSVELASTDDAQWMNPGWTYHVTEHIGTFGRQVTREYDIEVPAASVGGELNLALAAPAEAATPTITYIPYSLVNAKGDILAASGDNVVTRLGVGTNGQVLTADSAQALGVKWATPSGGGGGGAVDSVNGETGVVVLDATNTPPASIGAAATVHTHAEGDVTGLTAELDGLATSVAGKANTVHTHAEGDVTNLVADLALKAPLASPTFTGTVGGITKAMVGLANVDNTSDANKPVSTAQQTALDAKQPLNSNLTTVAGLTATTDNMIQSVGSAWASRTPTQVKTALALNNVTNTSDADKPVSTAQQTALDLKANLAGPTFTGTPAAPTAAQGTNTTQLATTAYVQTEAGLLVPKSLVDAKGDLLVGTAADTVGRLAVGGTNGHVLTVDSAEVSGMKWAAASGGSGSSYAVGARPKTGNWVRCPANGPVGANLTMTLNSIYFVPFILAVEKDFDRIGIEVVGAGSAGAVCRLGAWDIDDDGEPSTLLLDAGTVAVDTTGQKNITIAWNNLAAGFYLLGVDNQVAGGGVQLRATVSGQITTHYYSGASMFTGAEAGASMVTTGVTGAFGSNYNCTDNNRAPLIGLRAA
jgi:hypothetical protein